MSMASKSSKRQSMVGAKTSQTAQTTNSSATLKKPSDKFQCNACEMTFFYKTSLAAHQKNHVKVNTCQYCRRGFAISTGLHKHLRENCTKISISERKKLLDKDDKTSVLNVTTRQTSIRTPIRTPTLLGKTDKLLDLVYKSCSPSQIERLKAVPVKHFPPIKGIRYTPRKMINCFKCGEKFHDPSTYATHAEHCVPANDGGIN